MTQDEIIRMAVECQLLNASNREGLYAQAIERFAALVAAHEREACAKVCDEIERHKWEILTKGGKLEGLSPIDCAAAIRARNEK